MEEGLFPHARTLMNETEIEEERRTCYVGITRAERKLYITNAHSRMIFGRSVSYEPSRFINEIPIQYLEEREAKRQMGFGSGFNSHYNSYRSVNSSIALKVAVSLARKFLLA